MLLLHSKLGYTLMSLIEIYNSTTTIGPMMTKSDDDDTMMIMTSSNFNTRIVDHQNLMILIDVIGKNDNIILQQHQEDLHTALLKDGYNDHVINCEQKICSMYIPIDQLTVLAQLSYIHFIRSSISKTSIGSVTSEGDIAMISNQIRTQYNVNGTGLMIGVLSDSYNCLNGANQDIITGDLPSSSNNDSIIIVSDLTTTECNTEGSDEGRAMMQLIHDIAPGATLAFRTAYRGQADFANGIRQLANIGCDIIVDDVYYYTEPFYQDGIISQAVDDVVTNNGILYFSAMGNFGMNAWDALNGFVSSNISDDNGIYHQFDTTVSTGEPITYQIISIPNINARLAFNFQWSAPYYSVSGKNGSTSDLDIYFIYNNTVVAKGNDYDYGKDPIEIFYFNPSSVNSTDSYIHIQMQIQFYTGSIVPQYMKLLCLSNVNIIYEYGVLGTSTGYGHSNSAFGAGVGAASYTNTPAYGVTPPNIEYFSSFGGTPIVYDKFGNLLPSSSNVRNQPVITGPDGGITTFFGNSAKRFYGTSAAAPHVAAVAALLLEGAGGRKSLTPAAVYKVLQDTAIDMDDVSTTGFDVGFDYNTGYGFVNALAAFQVIRPPAKTPTKNPTTKTPTTSPTKTPTKSPTKTPVLFPIIVPVPVAAVSVPMTEPVTSSPVQAPVPIRVPVIASIPVTQPVQVPMTVPVKSPVQIPIIITSLAPANALTPMTVPVTSSSPVRHIIPIGTNAPIQATSPTVFIPSPTSVIAPIVTTDNNNNDEDDDDDCGLFGLRIFCPITFCGILGRLLLNLCKD